ncbi:hypothetical protein ACHAQA_007725 [Verticillium albo-atrum]
MEIGPLERTIEPFPANRTMTECAALLRARFPPPAPAALASGNFGSGFRTLVGALPSDPVNARFFH